MDDLLLGYLLNALDPADRAAVEAHLRDHPADQTKVDRLRRAIAPLATDQAGYEPPPGLAVAALARVAEHAVAERQKAPPPALPPFETPVSTSSATWPTVPDAPVFPTRRRVEAVLAAGIAFLAVGLVLGAVQKLRGNAQMAACQNNLRILYQGLDQYADARDGKFPQVGSPSAPTAGSFVTVLVETGHCPGGLHLTCPGGPAPAADVAEFRPDPLRPPGPGVVSQVGYAYTLGYRGPDAGLVGLRRDPETAAFTPLAADLPAKGISPADGPVSPHGRGHNVLYADGSVKFFTSAAVGPAGDDIFRNDAGRVRAGLHRFDASLGRATDEP